MTAGVALLVGLAAGLAAGYRIGYREAEADRGVRR